MRTRFEKRTHPGWYVFIALSTFTVFVGDLQTIVRVATWLFYLVPLGACLFVTRPAVPLQVALIATALIFADYVYSPPGIAAWIAQLNRGFAVVVLWAFAAQARLAGQVMGEHSLAGVGERIVHCHSKQNPRNARWWSVCRHV